MRENKHSLDRESDYTRSRLDSVGPFLDAHLFDTSYECGGFDAQQLRRTTPPEDLPVGVFQSCHEVFPLTAFEFSLSDEPGIGQIGRIGLSWSRILSHHNPFVKPFQTPSQGIFSYKNWPFPKTVPSIGANADLLSEKYLFQYLTLSSCKILG